MKTIASIVVLLGLAGCANTPNTPTTPRTPDRMLADQCPPGYVQNWYAGRTYCEPLTVQQQRQGPVRGALGDAMSQPMPSVPMGPLPR